MTMARYQRAGGRRAAAGGLMVIPLVLLFTLAFMALGYVAYALWPRWPEPPVAADAPALPVVVGDVPFNVPPQAMRIAMQRRAGRQERIDLVFLWPSLTPPDPSATAAPQLEERVFVTIAAAAGALPPLDRLKTIYPRYTASEPSPTDSGLAFFAFRDGTPYQGEDLVFDPNAPDKFLARCSRSANALTPATCLAESRIADAHITVRFPRDWLGQWREVEAGIGRLIAQLRERMG